MKPQEAYAVWSGPDFVATETPARTRNGLLTSTARGPCPRPSPARTAVCCTAHGQLLPEAAPLTPLEPERPGLIHLPLTPSLALYLQRLRELGAVEGAQGAVGLSPTLRPLLEALHHVLSGGEVEVRILRGGQHGILQELEQCMEQGLEEANSLLEEEEVKVDVAV